MQATPSVPTIAADAARHDIYLAIHKALRLMFAETLTQLGRADAGDAAQVDAALAQAGALCDLLQQHYHHEDEFLHPALERVLPGSSARTAGDHLRHVESLDALRARIVAVRGTDGHARTVALRQLYRAVALLMAEDLEHMHYEDTELNAVLWRHHSDDELIALEQALVASIAPPQMMTVLRWMIPAISAGERAELLGGARQGMPAEAFAAVLELAQQVLPPADWRELSRALDLQPSAQVLVAA